MDLQLVVVAGIIAVCAAYLLRKWVLLWFGKAPPTCGGCTDCETSHEKESKG